MEIITRQEKTLDGLRSRLFDTLDNVINNKIDGAHVECICAISEQIIKSAKLEVDTMLQIEENKRIDRREMAEATRKLKETINAITVPKNNLESTLEIHEN